ncbi:MAG: winged helix-turn-helix domain-containing protein [Candidatus Aquilonibacter sp.]
MISGSRKPFVNAAAGFQRRPSVDLRLLGRYEISLEREPIAPPVTAKARSLLAYLALHGGEPIRRETLMSEFWPDAQTTSARNNLKTALSSIRRVFRERGVDPETVLEVTRDIVRWIAPTTIDSREFQASTAEIDTERRDAIALYAGEFLPSDMNEWAAEARESLGFHFENLLRAQLAANPSPITAERLLALDPFSDEAYLALIEDAIGAGNRRGAQAIYRRYVAALAEVGDEAPRDLAAHVGLRAVSTGERSLDFVGRADELAEVARLVLHGASALIVTGVSGVGKSSFAREAQRRANQLTIVEASLDRLDEVRAQFPDAEELELGPLARDEVAGALRRLNPAVSADAIDAIWRRSQGHPAVLQGIVAQLEQLDATEAAAVPRLRLPRELERRFESMLNAAGSDVGAVAVLLALELRLDDDDLAALLDWSAIRVVEARERCAQFGAARPHVLEAGLRTLSTSRRTHLMERIAQRLKLHEDPNERIDAAHLLVQLGHRAEAAHAYLEAARAFHAAASWENAIRAVDAGLSALESLSASDAVDDLARELHLLKGRSLYQQGWFLAATRALESVLDVSDARTHRAIRAQALVLIGNALARIDAIGPAFEIARQAVEEAPTDGREDFAAHYLMARVLRDQAQYDASIAVASRTFERSMLAREWPSAVNSAHLVVDVSRRMLHIDTAFAWAPRLIDAGLLAGPLLEAEARHMYGALHAIMDDLDVALESFRHALTLAEMYRRRRSGSAHPLGQLEWMLHYSIAHTHVRTGNVDQAVAESEWLLRSPWMRNKPNCWQALSVAVNARLAAGTERDIAAAQALLERMPPAEATDPRAVLDRVARARFAARCAAPEAADLLRTALTGLNELALIHADQVHPYYYLVAESARGVEDLVSARATEAGRHYERRLIAAAGVLYARNEKTGAG